MDHRSTPLVLDREIVNTEAYESTVSLFRSGGILLPTFRELADPGGIPASVREKLTGVDPDAPHPLNLFRVHWYNAADRRGMARVPVHVTLPESLTGVPCPIVVLLGDRFPMISAHKVLATYACLAPRLVTGQFDPTWQRAVWPSTGNYCRGGVAVSRILGCRSIAVLPEGMSEERFRWLREWAPDPRDIVRTPGTESNVREIYEECSRLSLDPANVVINQFAEFGNHLAHYLCTGLAAERVFQTAAEGDSRLRLAAFVSATGSAGTLAAGDFLKDRYGSLTVAAEALQCPTMLYNGFGEHNIQGIGDKHIPLIHNVSGTDVVTAVSDVTTDSLNVLFNTPEGRRYLVGERQVPPQVVTALQHFGLSSICNVVASIKLARRLDLGREDVVLTVATDGAELYSSEVGKAIQKHFGGRFTDRDASWTFRQHMSGIEDDHLLELSARDRDRIFNLGYFTWVEQQGVSLADFEMRRAGSFWRDLRRLLPLWDDRIQAFNREAGTKQASG